MPQRSGSHERGRPFQSAKAAQGPLPASELLPYCVSLDPNSCSMCTPPWVPSLCLTKHNARDVDTDESNKVNARQSGYLEKLLCKF